MDGATRGFLASVQKGWNAEREAAMAAAAAATAEAEPVCCMCVRGWAAAWMKLGSFTPQFFSITTTRYIQMEVVHAPPLPLDAAATAPDSNPPAPSHDATQPPPPLAAPEAAASSMRLREGPTRLVFLGVAPALVPAADGATRTGGKDGGGGLLLLAAEVEDDSDDGAGSGLDWRPPPGDAHVRAVGGWQRLLVRWQQQHRQQQAQQPEQAPTTAPAPAPALALTNPLPGLQLLLDYHAAHRCDALFPPREQEALAAVQACSWRAQSALALLLSVGPLPRLGSRDAGGDSDRTVGALWALLAVLGGTGVPPRAVARRGVVRVLRCGVPPLPSVGQQHGSFADVPALRELEARGLVAHQLAWVVADVVKEAVGRLAFLYTGKWDLVAEEEDDDEDDGGGGGKENAPQAQKQQRWQLTGLPSLVQGAVSAASAELGRQATGSLTALAAALALLGGHRLGLNNGGEGGDTAVPGEAPGAGGVAAAAAVGRGLAHLFRTREEWERLLRARRWRCRIQRAVCGGEGKVWPQRPSKAGGGGSRRDESVLQLLRQVMWGLYPKGPAGGGRTAVGIKDYGACVTR